MDTNLNFVSFKKILIKKDFRSKHKVKTICIQETIFEKNGRMYSTNYGQDCSLRSTLQNKFAPHKNLYLRKSNIFLSL